METELDRIKLVVNADVQGAIIGTNTTAALGPPDLTASVKLLAKEVGIHFNVREIVYSSDGTSYSSVGIPSLNFMRRGGAGAGHSVEDTVRWLNSEVLQRQGEFIEEYLTRYVAESPVFPFERLIPEKNKQAIEKFYRGKMRKPPGHD